MKNTDMLTVIYSFKIKEGKEQDFIESWTEMTRLIYRYEGSYGSRLHKMNDCSFIGYAQWPDKTFFDKSGGKLPESAEGIRTKMRECCEEINKLSESQIVVDLIQDKQHPDYQ